MSAEDVLDQVDRSVATHHLIDPAAQRRTQCGARILHDRDETADGLPCFYGILQGPKHRVCGACYRGAWRARS